MIITVERKMKGLCGFIYPVKFVALSQTSICLIWAQAGSCLDGLLRVTNSWFRNPDKFGEENHGDTETTEFHIVSPLIITDNIN